MNTSETSLLIVGIGNTLRADDGIGAYVCRELSCLPLSNVDISFVMDLNTEWLEIFSGFDAVIMVDAGVTQPDEVRLERIRPEAYQPTRSSHYLDPGALAVLFAELFHTGTVLYTCSVPGYDFSLREGLSDKGLANAREAVSVLRQWLSENRYLGQA